MRSAMCKFVSGLLAGVALLFATAHPSEAQNRRWCTERGVGSWGFPNCAYDTYEQCAATASGLGLHCTTNPWYQPATKKTTKKSRRNHDRREN